MEGSAACEDKFSESNSNRYSKMVEWPCQKGRCASPEQSTEVRGCAPSSTKHKNLCHYVSSAMAYACVYCL